MFPLIGYACTATVLMLAMGYGYMRQSGRLDDEKMFHIVALLHDVDLAEIERLQGVGKDDVPLQESSFANQIEQQQIAARQLEAKWQHIQTGLGDFDLALRKLNVKFERYNTLRQEVEEYLEQQKKRVNDEGLQGLAKTISELNPKNQAKPIIVNMIKDGRQETVVWLLNNIKPRSRKQILQAFKADEEIDMLYDNLKFMLEGNQVKPKIENALDEIQRFKEQGA